MSESKKPVAVFIAQLASLKNLTDAFPPAWHAHVAAARVNPGYIASAPFDVAGRATGYLVLMLKSPEEVVADKAAAAHTVMKMTRYVAEDLGGSVIGLGSLTTSITDGGRTVAELIDQNGWPLRATHGDTGSVAAILDCIELIGNWIPPNPTVGIVGAYGVIGTALARHFSRADAKPLICCGPRPDKLLELERRLIAETGRLPMTTQNIRMMSLADLIITVTSHTSSLLAPDLVKSGAVIIDPAMPPNVAPHPDWAGRNIVVSNASRVRLPQVAVASSMLSLTDEPDGCPTGYACFAETMAQAVFGDHDHHVGEIDLDYVKVVRDRFNQLNFRHIVPRMFGKPIV